MSGIAVAYCDLQDPSLYSSNYSTEILLIKAEETPFLIYDRSAGRSAYKQLRVTILASGNVTVQSRTDSLPSVDYQTELSPEEMAAFHTLILSTDFFNQASEDPRFTTRSTLSELTIHLEGCVFTDISH